MSSESADGEQSNDWTLINANDDDEGQNVVKRESMEEDLNERRAISETAEHSSQPVTMDNFQLEAKISEIPTTILAKSTEAFASAESSEALPNANLKEGSDASDIERISDDGMEIYNVMEASVLSQASSFSLVNAPEGAEADMESLASSSSISVIQEDENGDLSNFAPCKDELPDDLDGTRVRSYTHTPNAKLNFVLNLLLALSVTMVVGLGVGHFIGWSSRWMHQHHLQQTHITKLKALQEELVNCLQNPESYYIEGNGESKACYEKVDYWQEKFEDILSKNLELQNFIDRSTLEDNEDENDEKCEEANQNIVAEYRQLKFHLITQQLENVATLRRMEALKRQEEETLDRVKQLEEENQELKAQVEEEEDSDAESTSDEDADQGLIKQLSDENKELKEELNQLMVALKMEQEEDDKKSIEELGCLREQINQLKVANAELQQVIAKIRYGQPPLEKQSVQEEERRLPPEMPTEIPAEKDEIENQKDDSVLHTWLVDNMNDMNLTGFMEYLVKVAMDKDAARKELKQLQENLKSSYEQLSEKAKMGIDTGKTILSDIQKSFQSKLQQIMKVDASGSALSIESIRKIGKTLKNTVEKMYLIGTDMLNTDDSHPASNNNDNKFRKQVDKLLTNFGKQWESIKTKMWGDKLSDKPGNKPDLINEKEELATKFYNDDVEKATVTMRHKHDEKSEKQKENKNSKSVKENRHSKENNEINSKKDGLKKKNSNLETPEQPRHGKKRYTTDPPKIKSKKLNEGKDTKEHQKKIKNKERSIESNKVNGKSEVNDKSEKKHESDKKRLKESTEKKKTLKKSDKTQKQSTLKRSKSTNKRTVKNSNHSSVPIENSGDWIFKRADERGNKRKNKRQSEWLFERAHNREKTRKESEKSEWYFERAKGRGNKHDHDIDWKKQSKSRNYKEADDDDDDDHHDTDKDEHEIKKKGLNKKKAYKNVKHQDSEEDSSDDEVRDVHKRQRYQGYRHHHHSYNFDWTIPNTAAYSY